MLVLVVLLAARAAAQTVTDAAEVAEKADELAAEKRWAEAADTYERAISLDPNDLHSYLGLSTVLLPLGEHARALGALDDAEARLGWSAELGAQRGIHLFQEKRWDDARVALEKVYAHTPDAFEAALYLGETYLRVGRWADAPGPLAAYLAHRPDALAGRDGRVRTRRAYALLRAGDSAGAETELDAVLADKPDDVAAQVVLATLYAQELRCDEALPLLDALVDHAADVPSIDYNRAICLGHLGRDDEALAAIDAYDVVRPGETRTAIFRARLYERLGEVERAIAEYQRALDGGLPVETDLGKLLERAGRFAEAIDYLWPAADGGEGDGEVLGALMRALVATGDHERALAVGPRYVDAAPDRLEPYVLLGREELVAGQDDAAEATYVAALALDPASAPARRGLRIASQRLADARMAAGDEDGARALLLRADELEPGVPAVVHDLAVIALDRGDAAGAAALLGTIELATPASRLLAGRAYAALGDADHARPLLGAVADDDAAPAAQRVEALLVLGVLARKGDPDDALATLSAAAELGASVADRPDLTAAVAAELAAVRVVAAEDALVRGRADSAARLLDAAEDGGALPDELADRAKVLAIFVDLAQGDEASALRRLGNVSDSALRQVLTVHSAGRAFVAVYASFVVGTRPSAKDFAALFADGLAAFDALEGDRRRGLMGDLLGAWVERALYQALDGGDEKLLKKITALVPASLMTDGMRNNLAAADAQSTGAFSDADVELLEDAAATVPEAHVNLAIAAKARKDDRRVIEELGAAEAAGVGGLASWRAWEERLHGQ